MVELGYGPRSLTPESAMNDNDDDDDDDDHTSFPRSMCSKFIVQVGV